MNVGNIVNWTQDQATNLMDNIVGRLLEFKIPILGGLLAAIFVPKYVWLALLALFLYQMSRNN